MIKPWIAMAGFLILVLSSTALGDVSVVKPVNSVLSNQDTIVLGSVQAGETFDIIFSVFLTSTQDAVWNHASITEKPSGWIAEAVQQPLNEKTLIARFTVPKNEANGSRRVTVKVSDSQGVLVPEEASFIVFVQDDLVKVDIDNLRQQAIVGNTVSYELRSVNDSIADHEVIIASTLSPLWFTHKRVTLKSLSSDSVPLEVTPGFSGVKEFTFHVKSALNDRVLESFSAKIIGQPTLKSKYQAGLQGFAFFTPSLLPYYLVNSFIGYFL